MRQPFLLARIGLLAAVLPLLIRCIPLPTLIRCLQPARRRWPHAERREALYYTRRIMRLGKGPFRRNCLRESLILLHLLGTSGQEVRFCLGAKKETGELHAHAWLELDGVPFTDPLSPRREYRLLYTHPA